MFFCRGGAGGGAGGLRGEPGGGGLGFRGKGAGGGGGGGAGGGRGGFGGQQRGGGMDFEEMLRGGAGAGHAGSPGQTHEAELTISLDDAYRGATHQITLRGANGDGERTYQVRIPPGTTEGS